MAYATDAAPVGISIGQQFASFRTSVKDRMAKARVYRTTVTELQSLSIRDLADLDISRGAINCIAMQAAYGK